MDSNDAPEDEEVEQDRRAKIAELDAEEGPEWIDRFKPGTFGCHELLDRTLILAEAIEQQLVDHPACLLNPEWYALADRAANALQKLYQKIGAESL